MDRAAYDALDALNWSKLRLIKKSPRHFKLGFGDDSSSFKLGTAAHMAVLEPDRFATSYVVAPMKRDMRTNAYKEFKEGLRKTGQEDLSQSEWDDTIAIRDAVRGHAPAMRYLSAGESEVGLTWTFKGEGFLFPCKGRADWVGEALVDLKTTQSSDPKSFQRSAYKYDYFGQLAWYHDGLFLARGVDLPCRIIAVDSDRPYIPTVYRVNARELEFGRNQYLELLAKLDHCQRSDSWPGYVDADETDLEVPTWEAA